MISPAIMPRLRMRRMISSSSGCSSGSPPLMVMTDVPSSASLSTTLEHGVSRNRLGKIVVFVAVFASQIAAADGNDVRQQRMVRGGKCPRDHARPAEIAVERLQTAAQIGRAGRHVSYLSIKPHEAARFAGLAPIGRFSRSNGNDFEQINGGRASRPWSRAQRVRTPTLRQKLMTRIPQSLHRDSGMLLTNQHIVGIKG